MKKKIGLYFGTFNPIHVGHLIIANHMVEFSNLDEIWMVVTPHNPLKKKKTLLDDRQRFEMVYRATSAYPKLKPSDIEFSLSQPNYTVNTLVYLNEKYPKHQFALLMGGDNLKTFHKWKNYDVILENYPIYVYPRVIENTSKTQFDNHKNIYFIDAPLMQISSTFIRKSIKEGKNVQPLLPQKVWEYLSEMNFYKK